MLLGRMKMYLLSLISIIAFATSCTTTKETLYFTGVKDTSFASIAVVPEPIIQNNDLLSISISSLSDDASMIFNTTNTGGVKTSNASGYAIDASGYLVNSKGDISLPLLGSIHVAGMTKIALKELITKMINDKKILLEPVVNIRFLNFKVTVIGEVSKPTVITVANEKISLLEAIGLAGDLTVYGVRKTVLLIREENNERITKRIDLNTKELFTSPYYYLKPNDVIYVEPNRDKVANSSRAFQWAPVIISTMSLGILIVTQVINK